MGDANAKVALQQLNNLLATAAPEKNAPSQQLNPRIEALESIRVLFRGSLGSTLVRKCYARVWPVLNRSILDKNHNVRQVAALALGAFGAAAVRLQGAHGSAGSVGPERLLSWALPQLTDRSAEVGSTALALLALAEYAEVGQGSPAADRSVPGVLRACQVLLEDEGTPLELLPPLLAAVTALAVNYPSSFRPFFQEAVDLLLGWTLEADLAASQRQLIADCLARLHGQWRTHPEFSHKLLAKLLSDMAGEVAERTTGGEQRLHSLAMCFRAVLQGIGADHLKLGLPVQTVGPILELIHQWISSADVALEKLRSSDWALQVFSGLREFAGLLGPDFAALLPLSFSCFRKSLALCCLSAANTCTLLRSVLCILAAQGAALPLTAVNEVLGRSSWMPWFRLHTVPAVTAGCAAIYGHVMCHPAESVQEEARRCVLEEVSSLLSALELCHPAGESEGEASPPRDPATEAGSVTAGVDVRQLSVPEVQALLCFDVQAIAVSLNRLVQGQKRPSKTVIHGRRQLKAVIVSHQSFFESYPSLQLVALQAVRLSSTLTSQKPVASAEQLGEGAWEGYVQESIVANSDLLSAALGSAGCVAAKLEALSWIASSAVGPGVVRDAWKRRDGCDITTAVVNLLVLAMGDPEAVVRGGAAEAGAHWVECNAFPPSQLNAIAEAALRCIGDGGHASEASAARLLACTAPVSIWSVGQDATAFSQGPLCSVDRKPMSGTLLPQQLSMVLSFLGRRPAVFPASWLRRLTSSLIADEDAEKRKASEDADGQLATTPKWHSEVELAWHATHLAAQSCVEARLRTHLGGPVSTFAVLERMLKDLPQECCAALSASSAAEPGTGGGILVPMALLAEFVDALEKNIFNASDGCLAMAAPSPAVAHFFRINRKVCSDWFSHARQACVLACACMGCPEGVLRHALARLQDLRSAAAAAVRSNNKGVSKGEVRQEVLALLGHAAGALYQCRDADGLLGLRMWAGAAFASILMEERLSVEEACNPSGPLGWMEGMALQVEGQLELAAQHFEKCLESELMTTETLQKTMALNVETYAALADWPAVKSWLEASRVHPAGRSVAANLATAGVDLNAILALSRFDSGDVAGAWAAVDLSSDSSGRAAEDSQGTLRRSELALLQAMLLLKTEPAQSAVKVATSKSLLAGLLGVASLGTWTLAAPLLLHSEAVRAVGIAATAAAPLVAQAGDLDREMARASLAPSQGTPGIALPGLLCHPLSTLYQDSAAWVKVVRAYKAAGVDAVQLADLQLGLATVARKQKNSRLAARLREACQGSLDREGVAGTLSAAEYEEVLLSDALGNHGEALGRLWDACYRFILQEGVPPPAAAQGTARACLKLASWLTRTPMATAVAAIPLLEPGLPESADARSADQGTGALQLLAGAATWAAVCVCPPLPKAWFAYATWCCSAAHEGLRSSSQLPAGAAVVQGLPQPLHSAALPGLSTDERNRLARALVLEHHEAESASVAELCESRILECSLLRKPTLMLERELSVTLRGPIEKHLGEATESGQTAYAMEEVLCVLRSARKRMMSLLAEAGRAFFQVVSLGNRVPGGMLKRHVGFSDKGVENEHGCNDMVLSSMLQALDIIALYGTELQADLQPCISAGSSPQWQVIVPQLYAVLGGSPEASVRSLIAGLLGGVAQACPWTLLYPACTARQQSAEARHLMSALAEQQAALADTQSLVHQLAEMAVLWEEVWHEVLQELLPQVSHRLAAVREQGLQLASVAGLGEMHRLAQLQAHYTESMQPVLEVLDFHLARCGKPPVTPHQEWFQSHLRPVLVDAVSALQTPPPDLAAVAGRIQPLEAARATLAAHQKKELPMAALAPRLAALQSSLAPMPGLDASDAAGQQAAVLVASVGAEVMVLGTKTRPKRVLLQGTDGCRYWYLLKGREDLRLDARLMQALRAANSVLRRDRSSRKRGLSARHYNVTPLGPRAGLIQWLSGLHSVYSTFCAWQQRNASAARARGDTAAAATALARPINAFYECIRGTLKEQGLRRDMPRREWPRSVKRKVLAELMQAAPRQLLARELWCASVGPSSWWARQQRFAGSVGVMSMLGYILGLGDRHLDNILIDLRTAEVVHIDYNVSFDRGLHLKIPEIVPFRLTQTLQAAMGPVGPEGALRRACEASLGALRRARGMLLRLLNAFVWDPLLDLPPAAQAAVVLQEEQLAELCGPEGGLAAHIAALHRLSEDGPSPMPAAARLEEEVSLFEDETDRSGAGVEAKQQANPDPLILDSISPPTIPRLAVTSEFEIVHTPKGEELTAWPQASAILSSQELLGCDEFSHEPLENSITARKEEKREDNDVIEPPLDSALALLGDSSFLLPAAFESQAEMPSLPTAAGEDLSPPLLERTSLGDEAQQQEAHEESQGMWRRSPENSRWSESSASAPQAQDSKAMNAKRVGAENLLARVRQKLEGIDNDRRLSVEDQVHKLLQQACSLDNLCEMYEGWTPWI